MAIQVQPTMKRCPKAWVKQLRSFSNLNGSAEGDRLHCFYFFTELWPQLLLLSKLYESMSRNRRWWLAIAVTKSSQVPLSMN